MIHDVSQELPPIMKNKPGVPLELFFLMNSTLVNGDMLFL